MAEPANRIWSVTVTHPVEGLSAADDGSTLVSGGWQPGSLTLLAGSNGSRLWTNQSTGDKFTSADINPAGDRITVTDSTTITPQTEHFSHQGKQFDRGGNLLWSAAIPASAALSPNASYFQTGHVEDATDLSVYRASDGALLWQVGTDLSPFEDVVFSPDTTHVLAVQGAKVRLYTVGGTLVWSRDFPGGIVSAGATSNNGRTTVVLVDDDTDTPSLTTIDQTGQTLGQLSVPGRWESVAVRSDGDLVLLFGGSTGDAHVLKATSRTATALWERTYTASAAATYGDIRSLGTGHTLVLVRDGTTATLRFVDGNGTTIQTLDIAARLSGWNVSPNGRYVAVLLGSAVELYSAPP